MIYDIIKNTVESLHKWITVTNQVNNGDGTYTLTLSEIYLIKNKNYILGDNSTKYKVTSITGLDIVIKKTDTDVLVTIQCLQPHFYAGQWQDYSNHLGIQNQVNIPNRERFPSVFLITEFPENNKNPYREPTSIELRLNDYTLEKTNDTRESNEFPYLISLKDKFLKELEKNDYVVRITNDVFNKIYNAELDVNSSTNRIALSLDITHLLQVDACNH